MNPLRAGAGLSGSVLAPGSGPISQGVQMCGISSTSPQGGPPGAPVPLALPLGQRCGWVRAGVRECWEADQPLLAARRGRGGAGLSGKPWLSAPGTPPPPERELHCDGAEFSPHGIGVRRSHREHHEGPGAAPSLLGSQGLPGSPISMETLLQRDQPAAGVGGPDGGDSRCSEDRQRNIGDVEDDVVEIVVAAPSGHRYILEPQHHRVVRIAEPHHLGETTGVGV